MFFRIPRPITAIIRPGELLTLSAPLGTIGSAKWRADMSRPIVKMKMNYPDGDGMKAQFAISGIDGTAL